MTKEARRPFTKCSSPRLRLNLWKNPHFEKNGPTKLPSQMGHKGSGAVYRTFRPPAPPAYLPACTNCVFRKRQVGGRRVISQTYLCHLHIVHLNVTATAHCSFGWLRKAILSNRSNRPKTVSLWTVHTAHLAQWTLQV